MFQTFRKFAQSYGEAIIRDVAIKQVNMVVYLKGASCLGSNTSTVIDQQTDLFDMIQNHKKDLVIGKVLCLHVA